MTEQGDWYPLLGGEAAQEAWQAIHDVAAALEGSVHAPERARDATLASGTCGLALFFSYLAEARSDDRYAEVARSCLEHAIEALAAFPMMPSLFEGFTGVGWTLDHLDGRLIENDEEGAHHAIDQTLLEMLRLPARQIDFDLISGLAGFGVYALEGPPRPAARECLELLVDRLEELSEEREPGGVAWFSPPETLPPHQRELAPRGYYNLGVSHGSPAVSAMLSLACAAGVAIEKARPLLDKSVQWLLGQESAEETGPCFPHWVGEGADLHQSRLAWCYGDLGIAGALLLTARSVGRADWESVAVRVARRAARRARGDSGIRDVGLCHGAAGAAHVFHRLYRATGDEELAEAARFWFRRALGMRRPSGGVAGFVAWVPDDGGVLDWRADQGLLTGAAGVALALLSAVSPIEPYWDRIFLTSIPPRVDRGG